MESKLINQKLNDKLDKVNCANCGNDYYAKYIFGNINDQTILGIWNSKKFKDVREMLQKNNSRQRFEICKDCDVPSKLIT